MQQIFTVMNCTDLICVHIGHYSALFYATQLMASQTLFNLWRSKKIQVCSVFLFFPKTVCCMTLLQLILLHVNLFLRCRYLCIFLMEISVFQYRNVYYKELADSILMYVSHKQVLTYGYFLFLKNIFHFLFNRTSQISVCKTHYLNFNSTINRE